VRQTSTLAPVPPLNVRAQKKSTRRQTDRHSRTEKKRGGNGGRRTHESALPRPDGPARDKVLHDEHIGDDALVITKRETADRGEHGAAERVRVGSQTRQTRGSIRVCVRVMTFAVAVSVVSGTHGEHAAAEIASMSLRAGGGEGGGGGGKWRGK
jgi:hypothetical protein